MDSCNKHQNNNIPKASYESFIYLQFNIAVETKSGELTIVNVVSAAPSRELAIDSAIANLADNSSELEWVCNGFAYSNAALKTYQLNGDAEMIEQRDSVHKNVIYFNDEQLTESGNWLAV